MQVISQTTPKRKHLRLIVAAFFSLLLIAEWGSHGVILSHNSEAGGMTISGSDRGHDDPCRTMVCSDGQRKDVGFKFSHESSQHNGFFQSKTSTKAKLNSPTDRLSHTSLVLGLSRPPDPAFHPPEIS